MAKKQPAKKLRGAKAAKAQPAPPPVPTPPAPLSPGAKAKWDQLVLDLRDREGWSERDRHALYILADSLATYEEAAQRIATDGAIVESKGSVIKHPMSTIQNQAWDRCCKLLAAFGLTPAGRHAMKQSDKKTADIEDLMGGDDD